MQDERLFAILTGDLIRSSQYGTPERAEVMQYLEKALHEMKRYYTDRIPSTDGPGAAPSSPLRTREEPAAAGVDYYLFRGDSFQVYLPLPGKGLEAALFIRTRLLSRQRNERLDARIAVGIGRISYFAEEIETMDGEAFRLSGSGIEKLERTDRKCIIQTPWRDANAELSVECALLDELTEHWTQKQAEVIFYRIKEESQSAVADILKISQPAVSQQLRASGFSAVKEFLDRFETIIPSYYVKELPGQPDLRP